MILFVSGEKTVTSCVYFSGVSFETSLQDLIEQIPVAMQVFARGVEAFITDPANENHPMKLIPKLSCEGSEDSASDGGGGTTRRPSFFGSSRQRKGSFLFEGSDEDGGGDEDDEDRKTETRWSFGESFHK